MTDQPPTDEAHIAQRREQWRRAAEVQRRKRGVAVVKGTVKSCDSCGEAFKRNVARAVRCPPCQRQAVLHAARQASASSNAKKGFRKIGDAARCTRCESQFLITASRQAHCLACRSLPDRDRWEAVTASARAHGKAYRERHPERVKALEAEKRKRRKANPAFTVNERMSAGVRYSLAAGKQGSSWEALVGYTKDDLVAHLERQFLTGMSWDRREEFHIDHIVPLASFSFETADDPEFRAAWALSNLRPLWALDNITKNDRRTHLL